MAIDQITTVDWAIIVILAFGIARGAYRGLIREIMGVAAVAGAYVAANFIHPSVESFVRPVVSERMGSYGVAYVVSFFLAIMVLSLAFRFAARVFKEVVPIKSVDRFGGAILGGAKGVLVVIIALFITQALPDGGKLLKGSTLSPLFEPAAELLGDELLKHIPKGGGEAIVGALVPGYPVVNAPEPSPTAAATA